MESKKKIVSQELVDGKYLEVSPNSIVFVQEDKIKPGNKKNDVIVLTEDGLVEGKMEGQYLKQAPYQLTKEAKEKYKNTYMVEAETGASLMSTPETASSNENTIMQIFPGEYVLGASLEKKDQNGNSVIEVAYFNENGMSYGFMEKDLLKGIDIVEEKQEETIKENLMRVETQNGVGLNCRSSAEIKENNIMEKIPSGAIVSLTGKDKKDGQRTWVEIEYQNENGNIVTGWVDNSYLKEQKNEHYTPNITSKELKKIINSVELNNEGRVTGIDSLGIKTNQIEKLKNSGITENVIKSDIFEGQNINISELNGNVNFVYLRIGGMGYGEEFKTLDNSFCKEQVKKCEELGIPYGLYYYSTSITEKEANIEYENIVKDLESLGDLKYNLLPFAIDVELGGGGNITRDRQYGHDVTNAKSYLTNKLQNNLGLDIMLYTSGNCTLSTTEKANILDLEEYHKLTGVENVWMPMPKQETGDIGRAYKDYLKKFPECMNLIIEQEVLDTTISNGAKIDIDTISKENYIKILQNVLERIENREKTGQIDIEYVL